MCSILALMMENSAAFRLKQYGLALPVRLEVVNAAPRPGRKVQSILGSAVVGDDRRTPR